MRMAKDMKLWEQLLRAASVAALLGKKKNGKAEFPSSVMDTRQWEKGWGSPRHPATHSLTARSHTDNM